MCFPVTLQLLFIVKILFLPPLRDHLKQGRHGDIHMTVINQFRHKAVKEGEKQGVDMAAVHIGIGHQDDFIIAQLGDVKVIAVSFRETAAEGINHGFDFRIGQNLVNAGFSTFRILPLMGESPGRTIPCRLGAASGGISFHDENFTSGRSRDSQFASFPLESKENFCLVSMFVFAFFFGFPDFGSFFRTAYDTFQCFQISVKIAGDFVSRHLADHLGGILVIQLGLGLSLKTGIRDA